MEIREVPSLMAEHWIDLLKVIKTKDPLWPVVLALREERFGDLPDAEPLLEILQDRCAHQWAHCIIAMEGLRFIPLTPDQTKATEEALRNPIADTRTALADALRRMVRWMYVGAVTLCLGVMGGLLLFALFSGFYASAWEIEAVTKGAIALPYLTALYWFLITTVKNQRVDRASLWPTLPSLIARVGSGCSLLELARATRRRHGSENDAGYRNALATVLHRCRDTLSTIYARELEDALIACLRDVHGSPSSRELNLEILQVLATLGSQQSSIRISWLQHRTSDKDVSDACKVALKEIQSRVQSDTHGHLLRPAMPESDTLLRPASATSTDPELLVIPSQAPN